MARSFSYRVIKINMEKLSRKYLEHYFIFYFISTSFKVTLGLISFFVYVLVRKDLEIVKHTSYNSTQEMFLS